MGGGHDTGTPAVPTQKIGRFKVAAGRESMSEHYDGQPEHSETYTDNGSVDGQDSESGDHLDPQDMNDTKPKGRFMVSPAGPEQEHSADEDGKSDLSTPGPEDDDEAPQPSAMQKKNVEAASSSQNVSQNTSQNVTPQKWSPPKTAKAAWTEEECSQWVKSLGPAYKPYGQLFLDNGVDGDLLSDEEPKELQEMLQNITPNKLHLKKIIKEWNKLQT